MISYINVQQSFSLPVRTKSQSNQHVRNSVEKCTAADSRQDENFSIFIANWSLERCVHVDYSKLRVIRIQWDLKNSDYAEKNTFVLVSLTRKFVRITRKFGLRGEKFIGFHQFDQKICSYYAEFSVLQCVWCPLQLGQINDPKAAAEAEKGLLKELNSWLDKTDDKLKQVIDKPITDRKAEYQVNLHSSLLLSWLLSYSPQGRSARSLLLLKVIVIVEGHCYWWRSLLLLKVIVIVEGHYCIVYLHVRI